MYFRLFRHRRSQEGAGRAEAQTVAGGVGRVADALVFGLVDVINAAQPGAYRGLHDRLVELVVRLRDRDVHRAAGTTRRRRAQLVVFHAAKHRPDVVPSPAGVACFGDLVPDARRPTLIVHSVDRCAAAHHIAALPDLGLPLGAGRQRPVVVRVKGPAREEEDALGDVDQRVGVRAAVLQHQDGVGGILTEAVGKNTARGAGADDDAVKVHGQLAFFLGDDRAAATFRDAVRTTPSAGTTQPRRVVRTCWFRLRLLHVWSDATVARMLSTRRGFTRWLYGTGNLDAAGSCHRSR